MNLNLAAALLCDPQTDKTKRKIALGYYKAKIRDGERAVEVAEREVRDKEFTLTVAKLHLQALRDVVAAEEGTFNAANTGKTENLSRLVDDGKTHFYPSGSNEV